VKKTKKTGPLRRLSSCLLVLFEEDTDYLLFREKKTQIEEDDKKTISPPRAHARGGKCHTARTASAKGPPSLRVVNLDNGALRFDPITELELEQEEPKAVGRPAGVPDALAWLRCNVLDEWRGWGDLTARRALDELSTLHVIESQLGRTMIRAVSRPAPRVQAILNAVGLRLPATVSWTAGDSPPALS
jgi:hypothetical protein